MDFEDILQESGGYGKFQKGLVWIFLVPTSIVVPLFNMNQIFMLSSPSHECLVPYINRLNITADQRTNLTAKVVDEKHCQMYSDPGLKFDKLKEELMLKRSEDIDAWFIEAGSEKEPCTDFTYDKTNYDITAVTKWDLVCSRSHLPSLVYTLWNVGVTIGTLLFGTLADRLGRKITFFIPVSIAIVCGISSVLVGDYVSFLILRFACSFSQSSLFQIPYIILLELACPDDRTKMLGITCVAWTVGMCVLPLVAWLSRNFVILGVTTYATAIPLMFYWWFVPESPRWLICRDRITEASDILRKIAITNGVEEIPDLESKLIKAQKNLKEDEEAASKYSALDLVRQPRIRKHFLIICASNVANACAYHGLHINISNLAGNEFLNFFYLGLVETPAYFFGWWAMEKFGRRWPNVILQVASAASCFIPVAVFDETVAIAASIATKFSCSAAFMIMYQQGAELMPTGLRSIALGITNSAAAFFSIGMPYVIYLGRYGTWIPFLALGVIVMAAGMSSAWLPETLGYNLCQTVDEAEDFGKKQTFFAMNLRRDSQIRSPKTKEAKRRKNLIEASTSC